MPLGFQTKGRLRIIAGSSYFYSAYQLIIQSAFPVFGWFEIKDARADADIIIERYPSNQPAPFEAEDSITSHILDEHKILVVRSPVRCCLIEDGSNVILQPSDDASEDQISLFIETTVLQLLLHQRGLFLVHASAIQIEGSAAVFMAQSRGGKSTTAAFLSTLGYSIIADDLVALQIDDKDIYVIPANTSARLWPDTLALIGQDSTQLPRWYNNTNKRMVEMDHRVHLLPVHLKRIYALVYGSRLEVHPLTLQEAFQTLFLNLTFRIFYRRDFLKFQNESKKLLKDCTTVAERIPVLQLQRPISLDLLPQIADMVVMDMKSN